MRYLSQFAVLFAMVATGASLPEAGKWDFTLKPPDQNLYLVEKRLYKGAIVYIKVNCNSEVKDANVTISLAILQSRCWYSADTHKDLRDLISSSSPSPETDTSYHSKGTYRCNDHISLKQHTNVPADKSMDKMEPNYVIQHDGIYVLGLSMTSNGTNFSSSIHIEMKSDYGYLSANDWPLLHFYGFMCIYYIFLGLVWLALSALQWRDLVRVQFWIGGVIFLGMLEKATFYAEYQSINNTGIDVPFSMIFAEWVSCAKRTLARMLVIIVSLGFGIVKPRLGPILHRVVAVGLLYFVLAASESYLRITRATSDSNKDLLVASVPLAVLDSAICWWIFSALVNTTRTLRLRRNETKLSVYRHFTNTLIFCVLASVVFMLYCLKEHHYKTCLTVWKNLWLEDAFWPMLFSMILTVIIILWRPTNNNQRYAFVPLLDTADDQDEEEHLVHDAYGVKVRIHHQKPSTSPHSNSVDDDLKWLEENVISDAALPILDSDDELVNTRFEVSKMQ